jgi:hypothetical protein
VQDDSGMGMMRRKLLCARSSSTVAGSRWSRSPNDATMNLGRSQWQQRNPRSKGTWGGGTLVTNLYIGQPVVRGMGPSSCGSVDTHGAQLADGGVCSPLVHHEHRLNINILYIKIS